MSKIKVGIIGCGTMANNAHLPSYQKNSDVEIAYCCNYPSRTCPKGSGAVRRFAQPLKGTTIKKEALLPTPDKEVFC